MLSYKGAQRFRRGLHGTTVVAMQRNSISKKADHFARRLKNSAFFSATSSSSNSGDGGNDNNNNRNNNISNNNNGSVLRFGEMSGTWVVFSKSRRNRPKQMDHDVTRLPKLRHLPRHVDDCPFCIANQHLTPNVLFKTQNMRVIPNLYPAVSDLLHSRIEDQNKEEAQVFLDQHPLNNEVPAVGFHEVVVESPHHNAHLAESSTEMAFELLQCFVERGRAHRSHEEIEHTVFFKNHGPTAGASLVHPHSQIVSTPVVPVEAERLQHLAMSYYRRNRTNLYERIVEEEMQLFQTTPDRSRVVEISDNFISFVPYASVGPYMLTILPRYDTIQTSSSEDGVVVDGSDFLTTSDELLEECATILQSSIRRLHILLDEPCFNMVIQTAPVANRGVQAAFRSSTFYRWSIRITPRLGAGAMAGFELGSGFYSNSHLPEEDAAELRGVEV